MLFSPFICGDYTNLVKDQRIAMPKGQKLGSQLAQGIMDPRHERQQVGAPAGIRGLAYVNQEFLLEQRTRRGTARRSTSWPVGIPARRSTLFSDSTTPVPISYSRQTHVPLSLRTDFISLG